MTPPTFTPPRRADDLPPEWRDHFEESVAVAVEGGATEQEARRERFAAVVAIMEQDWRRRVGPLGPTH